MGAEKGLVFRKRLENSTAWETEFRLTQLTFAVSKPFKGKYNWFSHFYDCLSISATDLGTANSEITLIHKSTFNFARVDWLKRWFQPGPCRSVCEEKLKIQLSYAKKRSQSLYASICIIYIYIYISYIIYIYIYTTHYTLLNYSRDSQFWGA